MAETLDRWPTDGKGGARYPWNQWLDGQIWKLTRGEDFMRSPSAVRAAAWSYARYRHWKISCSVPDNNTLIIQRVITELEPSDG